MNDIANVKNKFKDKSLFDLAMTHRSWVNEHLGIREHNERLEFLGDAILEYIVSEELFQKFPSRDEGFLTTLRASLVNTTNLAEIAKEIGLGNELFLSRGEEDGGGRSNTSLLADTVEALIGALYIDQGIKGTKQFVKENLLSRLKEKLSQPLKDAKSRLQELVQKDRLPAPRYQVVKAFGPDHDKEFSIEAIVDTKPVGRGTGRSKAEAEQNAAQAALVNLTSKR